MSSGDNSVKLINLDHRKTGAINSFHLINTSFVLPTSSKISFSVDIYPILLK